MAGWNKEFWGWLASVWFETYYFLPHGFKITLTRIGQNCFFLCITLHKVLGFFYCWGLYSIRTGKFFTAGCFGRMPCSLNLEGMRVCTQLVRWNFRFVCPTFLCSFPFVHVLTACVLLDSRPDGPLATKVQSSWERLVSSSNWFCVMCSSEASHTWTYCKCQANQYPFHICCSVVSFRSFWNNFEMYQLLSLAEPHSTATYSGSGSGPCVSRTCTVQCIPSIAMVACSF